MNSYLELIAMDMNANSEPGSDVEIRDGSPEKISFLEHIFFIAERQTALCIIIGVVLSNSVY